MSTEIKKIGYTHDAMIDVLVRNPTIKSSELAEMFGYSQAWVSRIKWSESFQKRLRERQDELVDPELRMSVNERFKALVVRAIDVMEEKLSAPADEVSDFVLSKALELAGKGLGVGGFSTQPQVQVQMPATDHLNKLAENLLLLQKRTRSDLENSTIEMIPNPIPVTIENV